MAVVTKQLTQVQSDLIWFAKGWWLLYDQKFAEGSDIQQLQIMANRYYGMSNPNVPKTLFQEMIDLVGIAIVDCTYPEREFSEFFLYWDAMMRRKLTGETVKEIELEKIMTEALLVILMRWDIDSEYYELKKPSWPLPKKEKK